MVAFTIAQCVVERGLGASTPRGNRRRRGGRRWAARRAARSSATGRATFYFRYSAWLSVADGPVHEIAGDNAAYDHESLLSVRDSSGAPLLGGGGARAPPRRRSHARHPSRRDRLVRRTTPHSARWRPALRARTALGLVSRQERHSNAMADGARRSPRASRPAAASRRRVARAPGTLTGVRLLARRVSCPRDCLGGGRGDRWVHSWSGDARSAEGGMTVSSPRDIRRHGPRPATLAAPHVSVVVASNRSRALLDDCLAALLDQCERARAELIVARDDDDEGLAAIAQAYPTVRSWWPSSRARAIPELRGAGMREATGDIVMLTEDHCVPGPHWVEELCLGVDNVAEIAGGGMDNAQRSAPSIGPPISPSTVSSPPRASDTDGAHAAHRAPTSPIVAPSSATSSPGPARASGRTSRTSGCARGEARCTSWSPRRSTRTRSYEFWDFCVDRYEHGRDYARTRLVEEPGARRWLLTAVTPLLPVVILSSCGPRSRADPVGRVPQGAAGDARVRDGMVGGGSGWIRSRSGSSPRRCRCPLSCRSSFRRSTRSAT